MTWITLPSVSVQNGSKIVTVNNTQTTHIKVGDALLIGNYQPVEIAGVFATQLSLRTNWSNAAQANASAVVLPTFGDFNTATQALRQATQVTQGNFKTLEDWGTKLGNITFEGQDNSKHTARTLLQMDADVSELEEQANNLIVSLSGRNFALSKAIVDALRSGNKEQYAASGFIHDGKHFNSGNLSSVNEGMTVDIGTPNVIYLGARDGVTGGNVGGSSKTSYPVMNVAGFEVHLLGVNASLTNWQANTIKLPVEPNGTVVSDSSGNCRGTGKPTLDLSKEVDPKYGDVASSVNEAVARAFEGVIKNGNFRNGVYSGWTGQSATATLINNDAEVRVDGTGSSPINQALGSVPFSVDANTKYEVTFELTDSNNTASGIILTNGLFDDTGLGYFYTNKAGKYTKTFTSNSAGTVQVRLHAGTVVGAYATFISHVSVKRLTEEVVINRV
ncbi:TPA: hypothetical protein I7120_22025, partial [Vibrio vulnificus]|nr:hypothetical protein [Vibrio vulnificus]